MDFLAFAFGYAGAAALPSSTVDVGLCQMVSSVAGGCYELSCDTLPQPLALTGYSLTHVALDLAEALRHRLDDAFDLIEAFAGLHELLVLRVFARYLPVSLFKETPASIFHLVGSVVYCFLDWFGSP